jgi:soluble lytic murein transglycosylase
MGRVLALLALLLAAAPAVALEPELRDRILAALATARAGNHLAAGRQLADAAVRAGVVAEYLLYLSADHLARAGDPAGARTAALHAVDRAGDGPIAGPALLLAAREAQRAGDEAGAAGLFRRWLDRHPDHAEAAAAKLALGLALEASGQPAEAARAYRGLWLVAPGTPEADAAAVREQALAQQGVTLPAPSQRERLERAERLLAAGRLAGARGEAEGLLAESPPAELGLRALRVVSEASRRGGRHDEALRAVDRAIALSAPERRPPWLLERARLVSNRQREAALAALAGLARDFPQSPEAPEALLLRAQLLEAIPRLPDAVAEYRRLAQEYPKDDRAAQALWRLGWLAWFRAAHGEAAQHWGRLATARSAPLLLREGGAYWAGRAHQERGEAAEAERHWTALLSQVPRGYYGVLAARRLGRAATGIPPARSGPGLPGDPAELLRAEPRWVKVEALRALGLADFATLELDEIARRAAGQPARLYAVSAAHAQDGRHHLALRILRREFVPLARSGDPAAPRAFWELYYPLGWRAELEAAAARAALDPFLVAAVAREESSYDPRARSRAGARGLMQLMPGTARPMAEARGLQWGGGGLLDEPGPNLEMGTAFLARLLREFGDARLAVAAYNAGPRRVREWWAARRGDDVEVWVEQIPFNETRFFVKRVVLAWEEYRRLYGRDAAGAPAGAPGRPVATRAAEPAAAPSR